MLKDIILKKDLIKKGFAVLPQISKEDLIFLRRVYEDLHINHVGSGHISTAFSENLDYKNNCNNELGNFFSKVIGDYFTDFEIYGTSFVYKTPSADSALRPHQDWSLTDEDKYQQYNFWIPLCDIDETNGMLYVIPGTHFSRLPFIRATNVDYFYENNRSVVLKHGIPLKVKAGTVIVFDNSIIHYSDPNLSSSNRVAAVCTFYKSGAPSMMFFHDKKNKKINAYFAEKGFALKYEDFFNDIQQPPKELPLYKTVDFKTYDYFDYELHDIFNTLRKEAGYAEVLNEFPKPSIFKRFLKNIKSKFNVV